jgi:hypothetical protein
MDSDEDEEEIERNVSDKEEFIKGDFNKLTTEVIDDLDSEEINDQYDWNSSNNGTVMGVVKSNANSMIGRRIVG